MLAKDLASDNEKAGCKSLDFGVKRLVLFRRFLKMLKRALRPAAFALFLTFALLAGAEICRAQGGAIADKTKEAQKLPGFFNLYWDAKAGKLWLDVDKWNTEFLYQSGLKAGVGSNDIGLDRGQMG